jgi:HTH-type transcriptional regulator/antitoxin HigA
MTKTNTRPVFGHGIPKSFTELCGVLMPRPIHDAVARKNALEAIDALAGLPLNADQEDYLEMLSLLVNEYEAQHRKVLPKAAPLDVLRYLVKENDISGRELGRILGVDETLGIKILSGERNITVEHAKKLGIRFAIHPTAFLNV